MEGDKTDLVPAVVKLAGDEKASAFGRVHAMWTLAGLGKLEENTVRGAIGSEHWFLAMTGLRLAGESKGVADFFPDGFKPLASELAKREASATLVSYSSALSEKGYPSRAVRTYKDKEADWVKKDKDLLSSYRKGRDQYKVTSPRCLSAAFRATLELGYCRNNSSRRPRKAGFFRSFTP